MTTTQFSQVIQAIDEINKQDPNTTEINKQLFANEYLYSERMTKCLGQYWPEANDFLKIAVRAQHIKRWHIARTEYPEGKKGYLDWRKALGIFHAELTAELMASHGYSEDEAEQTSAIIRKASLKRNSDSQTLEDVACLVFLSYYFEPFAAKHSEEKVISIVQKTWKKMSERGHEIALTLSLPKHLGELVNKALA